MDRVDRFLIGLIALGLSALAFSQWVGFSEMTAFRYYYQQTNGWYYVWPRNQSPFDHAGAGQWSSDDLKEEAEEGVLLIPAPPSAEL